MTQWLTHQGVYVLADVIFSQKGEEIESERNGIQVEAVDFLRLEKNMFVLSI